MRNRENSYIRHVEDDRRNLTGEGIVGEVKVGEAMELGELLGDGAGKRVMGKGKMKEKREITNVRRHRALQ